MLGFLWTNDHKIDETGIYVEISRKLFFKTNKSFGNIQCELCGKDDSGSSYLATHVKIQHVLSSIDWLILCLVSNKWFWNEDEKIVIWRLDLMFVWMWFQYKRRQRYIQQEVKIFIHCLPGQNFIFPTQISNLKHHITAIHMDNEPSFKWDLCSKSVVSKCSLVLHIASVHKGWKHQAVVYFQNITETREARILSS